jgi:fructose-1,6-bisphosphatase/inositol monophosphatase family enzyme
MRFTHADADRIGEILSRAAQAEIMSRFGALTAAQVREKSSRFNIVTDADEAAGHLRRAQSRLSWRSHRRRGIHSEERQLA